MPAKFECPICEFVFEAIPDHLNSITCPECRNFFEAEHKAVTETPVLSNEVVAKKTIYKKRRPLIPPWLTLAFFSLVAIALSGVLIHVLNRPKPTENPQVAAGAKGASPSTSQTVGGPNLPNSKTKPKGPFPQFGNGPVSQPQPEFQPRPELPKVPDAEPPIIQKLIEPSPRSLSRNQLNKFWDDHHSRILQLTIHTSTGKRKALGTIIDSRGWIATSLRALAGAVTIDVSQIPPSRDADTTSLLQDQVRGVIATSAEHDLAILSVNRRFVVSFSETKISNEDDTVPAQYLAHCFFPSENSPVVVRENRVEKRGRLSELDSQTQKLLEAHNLNSESTEWILLEPKTYQMPNPILAGSPCFNDAGELVTLSTNASTASLHVGLPSVHLNRLLETVSGSTNPTQIQTLEAVEQALATVGIKSLPPEATITKQHPLTDVVEYLDQLATTCEQNQWQIDTEAGYTALQAFIEKVVEMKAYLYRNPDDPEEAKFEKLFEFYYSKMREQLLADFAPQDPESAKHIETVNGLAMENLRSRTDRVVMFFGTVQLTALESPPINGQDTLTLGLNINQPDNAAWFTAIYDPTIDQSPSLRPGTSWFFVVSSPRPPKLSVRNGIDGQKVKSNRTQLLFLVGPF